MAGKISYLAPIDNASGKIFGTAEKFVSVTRKFGDRIRGCAFRKKERNYTTNPLTQKEIAQRTLFQQATANKKLIRLDMQKRNQWIQRWRDETDPELVTATFNGYLMKMSMKGHITADGAYQE